MVRAPCCEKMGLKKGPWTPEEDRVLVAYIQQHGHENWRALPKQAGLLRCGKSCRLRWINYLRPDIKRGNFTKEEEETIIKLHELLGNRWSAIASRLPGRTDNEIKNVWHTHLKKRFRPNQTAQDSKQKSTRKEVKAELPDAEPIINLQAAIQSCSENSSSADTKEEMMVSWSDFDENLWADASLVDYGSVCSFPDDIDDEVACWFQVFTEAGDLVELPCI